MAYGDSVDPKSRVVSVALVGIITFLLGWLLVSGLAIEVAKKAMQKLDVVDIQEPPPPEEPPPPPPADLPPPPQQTRIEVPPSPIARPVSVNIVPTPAAPVPTPPAVVIPPVAPSPPPPPREDRSRGAAPRGNEASWVTTDDYPSSALREEAQGVTGVRVSVGADGRVTSCDVTSSSGNAALDQAACRNIQRRARFTPAQDADGNPTTGSYSKRVRWQMPER